MTAIRSQLLATIALMGAAVAVSLELALRTVIRKRDKSLKVRIAKFILGFSMGVKTCFFLSFYANNGNACYVTGRFGDIFYHIAMTAGTFVLLSRIQSITNARFQRTVFVFHTFLTVLRLCIGIVDTVLIQLWPANDGQCTYVERNFWGPVYTLYDTCIDLYVTLMISIILVVHIRRLEAVRMPTNTNLYVSVIYHNIIRTVALTISNLTSAIFIIADEDTSDIIMLLWPIINMVFVVLVGYDTDTTRAISDLRRKHWDTMMAAKSQKPLLNVNLGIPNVQNHSIDEPITPLSSAKALSNPHFDLQTYVGDTYLLDNIYHDDEHGLKDIEDGERSAPFVTIQDLASSSDGSSKSAGTTKC